MKITATSAPGRGAGGLAESAGQEWPQVSLPTEALDDRIAIVGTAGSGKTYAAKGFVERLLESGARVAIVAARLVIAWS
jgi:polynucleotide 5'-kinase involved in rRNA processing